MGTVFLIILALFILFIAFRYLKGTSNSGSVGNDVNYMPQDTDADNVPSEVGIDNAENSDDAGYSDDAGSGDDSGGSDGDGND